MKKISEIIGFEPIDIHSHFDHNVPGDRCTIVKPVERDCHSIFIDDIKAEYDNVGIHCGGFSTYSSLVCKERTIEENAYLFDLMHRHDWMYQWVVLHPDQSETFHQVEKMIQDKKVLGIKIHASMHRYNLLEKSDKILSFANDLGAVVLMHNDLVGQMTPIADKYPNMKLIIAHLQHDEYMDAVKGTRHGNIYVDTSGMASNQNNIIERAVEKVGAEHVLFGTDTYSTAFQLGRIAFARIKDEDKKTILLDNALNMFPHAFEDLR